MTGNADGARDRLKRAAYARDATDRDRAALADYERRHPSIRSDAPASGVASVTHGLRRFWPIAAVAGAVIAGLAGGWLLRDVTTPAESSLAVFDRPAERQDTHAPALIFGDLGVTDTRLLGRFDGVAVWGAIAASPREDGTMASLVCLGFLDEDGGGGASCVTRPEFMAEGIRRGLYTWGPTGDVGLVDAEATAS